MIHDRNNGVFMLNILTLEKSQITDRETSDEVVVSRGKANMTKNWRGTNIKVDSDSGEDSDRNKDDLALLARPTYPKPTELPRYSNCGYCPYQATPNH